MFRTMFLFTFANNFNSKDTQLKQNASEVNISRCDLQQKLLIEPNINS